VAKLKTTAESYNRESSLKELRNFLANVFAPSMKDCYQEVLALPALDEIQIKPDKVSLVIYEPYTGGDLHPDLQQFYNDLDFKNRILFLSGPRDTLETLLQSAAELEAITYILDELHAEKVPDNDPQRMAAQDMHDNIMFQLLSAARETFTTLIYPHGDQLVKADFLMNFTDNNYNGEKQIRETLKEKQKFTDDISSDAFRNKCEQRLFTQKVMPWTEIKRRAAMNIRWQWHRMDALDMLKEDLVRKDQWREDGGHIEKPPFPQPETGVRYQELKRDDNTGVVTLKLVPVYGDTIHYEVGANATTDSLKISDMKSFQTDVLTVPFLCVDSTREHETGNPVTWRNRITIKSRVYQDGENKMIELRAAPEAPIRYTTDGSDPKISGVPYDAPFVVPPGTLVVLAIAEKDRVVSELHRLEIDWKSKDGFKVDPGRAITWKREHMPQTTKESYEFLGRLKKYEAAVPGPRVSIVGQHWLELAFDDRLALNAEKLETAIDHLRSLLSEGQDAIDALALKFPTGQRQLDWVKEVKTEIKPQEVEQ
jgi:hypothetical protein